MAIEGIDVLDNLSYLEDYAVALGFVEGQQPFAGPASKVVKIILYDLTVKG